MLVKCACSNCGHSYLADDQAGELDCPRCGVGNDTTRNPSDVPSAPAGQAPDLFEPLPIEDHGGYFESSFAPLEPPPMYVSADRFGKGLVFGAVFALLAGGVLGGALASVRVIVPGVAAAVLGLVAGAACRYGFGGRTSAQTKGRAIVAGALACTVGLLAFVAGGWGVERMTGIRCDKTREDLDEGLRTLTRQRTRAQDPAAAIVLDGRIAETERLRAMGDAQIEDYLWKQEAQVAVAPLAYAKLRATVGPVVRLGPKGKDFRFRWEITAAALAAELVVAVVLALRGILPR
jgi:hypothetical protein